MAIPRSVEEFLAAQQVPYSVIPHRRAYTAQEEAAVAHVPGRQWAKTVACVADERPVLAVVPASAVVDFDRLRELAGAGAIRLATEREFEGLYPDCELGAMPPLGPLYGQPVFVDRALTGGDEIVFEGGTHTDAVKVTFDDFARAVHPTVGDFGRVRRTRIDACGDSGPLIAARCAAGTTMHIELSRDEAQLLSETLRHHVTELDKEINRTDSFEFKRELQDLDRTIERILGRIAVALEQSP